LLSSVALVVSLPPAMIAHAAQWITSAIALALAFIVWRLIVAAIERFYARRFVSRIIPRISTYKSLTRSLAGVLIFYIIGIELLHIWAVNITPALWSATVLSAVIAFGAQAIVRDVLTGIFFLFEDSFDVGDGIELVTANGIVSGTVDAMSLRITRVIDAQGRISSVPNGSIVYVTNATRLPSRVSVRVLAPLRADMQLLRRTLEDSAQRSAQECGIDPASTSVRIEDVGVDTLTLAIEFEASRTAARKAESLMRERAVLALQAAGLLPGGAAPPGPSA